MTAHTHSYPADELDCGTCRAGLLEAFRAPVDADHRPMNQPLEPVLPDMEPGARPHLFPGPEHTRTVDIDPPVFDHSQVQSSITPHEDAPGGVWRAWCPCGWRRNGTYVRPAGALPAKRLAEQWAARHRANPLEGTEE